MNIPALSSGQLSDKKDISVAPLSVVILLKLQAWEDHLNSTRDDLRLKHTTDVMDIQALLPIAVGKEVWPHGEWWLPGDLIREGQRRVYQYVLLCSF